MINKKKIVILGGGFGGLYTFLGLKKYFSCKEIEVTIVNNTNYFLFTPMLHEVATGGLSHHQVVESIRQLIYKSHATLHVAEVVAVDTENQVVDTTCGLVPYDILVVSLGSTTNFFNTPGAEANSLTLKDLRGAIKMRSNFIDAFENASQIKDVEKRKKELSFCVIGGGPTGVELVAETAELFLDTFSKYYKGIINEHEISLYLINRGPEILAPFDQVLRNNALHTLQNKGIKVLVNTGVKEVKKSSVILDDGTILPVKHIVWTAGVKPNTPVFTPGVPLDQGGRIEVNEFMQVTGFPNIFAIGDVASMKGADGRPLPMLAQVAVRQGKTTASNIKKFIQNKNLKSFTYKSEGELVSLGRLGGVANIRGFKFSGPLAWFMWRTIYLFKFISNSKKFKIALDWTINLFYPRDITKA